MEAGVVDGGAVAPEHGDGVRGRAAAGPFEAGHLAPFARPRLVGDRDDCCWAAGRLGLTSLVCSRTCLTLTTVWPTGPLVGVS